LPLAAESPQGFWRRSTPSKSKGYVRQSGAADGSLSVGPQLAPPHLASLSTSLGALREMHPQIAQRGRDTDSPAKHTASPKIVSCTWPAACSNVAATPMDRLPPLRPPSREVAELRSYTALVRALLDELDRIVPSQGANAREDALDQQLVNELRRVGSRILECTATMTTRLKQPLLLDSEPQHPRLAKTRASESAPGLLGPSLDRMPAPSGGE
jgi:hypothetical protein